MRRWGSAIVAGVVGAVVAAAIGHPLVAIALGLFVVGALFGLTVAANRSKIQVADVGAEARRLTKQLRELRVSLDKVRPSDRALLPLYESARKQADSLVEQSLQLAVRRGELAKIVGSAQKPADAEALAKLDVALEQAEAAMRELVTRFASAGVPGVAVAEPDELSRLVENLQAISQTVQDADELLEIKQ